MSHRIGRLPILVAALALLVLLPVRSASAASREAREREARKACLTGDYAKGVAMLADLFLDTKNPTYIFNQGRCFEQNLKYRDAVARFEEYLRVPDSNLSREDREAAEKHIAICKESLAQERGSSSATTAVQAAPPPPSPPASTPAAEPSKPTEVQLETQPPATHGRGGLRTAAIVSASVGVAAVVAAIVLNVKANSMVSEMESTGNGYSPAKVDDRNTYETLSWVGYGLGAACMATGAVLFGIGIKTGGTSSTSVALLPAVGPSQAGALLTGGF